MTSLHECIRQGDYEASKHFVDSHRGDQHWFNNHNESAAAVALRYTRFDIYDLLLSRGFRFGPHERMEEIVQEFSFDNKLKIREIHIKNLKVATLSHLKTLCEWSKLSHDSKDEFRHSQVVKISRAFEELNKIEGLEPILKTIASVEDLLITFDFDRYSIHNIDPTKSNQTSGSCYTTKSEILIGAKGVFKEAHLETLGVMIHEICHLAMNLTYDNNCEPYVAGDVERKQIFDDICNRCEAIEGKEMRISNVFKYPEERRNAELIVRVPQLLAQYSKKPEELRYVKIFFRELFDFFENYTLPDLRSQVPKKEAMRNLNKQSGVLSALRNSESFLNSEDFNVDTSSEKCFILLSNCPQVTFNAIYHQHKNDKNFYSKFMFLKLEDFENSEGLVWFLEMQNMLTKPRQVINCDQKDFLSIRKFVGQLQEHNVMERIVLVVNMFVDESISSENDFENLFHDWEKIEIKHCMQQFTIDYKIDLLSNEVNFQGKLMKLNDIVDLETMLDNDSIPLDKLIKKQNIQIGNEIKFDEVEMFVERKFISVSVNLFDFDVVKYSAEDVMNLSHECKTILISDKPGMGKSTEMKMIAEQFKTKFPSHWVVFMDLKKYFKSYQKDGENQTAFDRVSQILSFFCEKILNLSNFEAKVFEELFKMDQICFFMDGFDEICPSYKQFLKTLITGIRQFSENQLWISTRPHIAEELQKLLPFITFKMEDFSKTHRKEFFRQFFSKETSSQEMYDRSLRDVDQLFHNIDSDFGSEVLNPLLLYMIAKSIKGESFEPLGATVFSIYDQFIKTLVLHCKDKGPEAERDLVNYFGTSVIKKFYQKKALDIIMPHKTEKFNILLLNTQFPAESDLTRFGLLYSDGDEYYFIHRTFAEFFVAQFTYENIFGGDLQSGIKLKAAIEVFVEVFIAGGTFEVVARFIDNAAKAFEDKTELKVDKALIEKTFYEESNRKLFQKIIIGGHLNVIKVFVVSKFCRKLWLYKDFLNRNVFMLSIVFQDLAFNKTFYTLVTDVLDKVEIKEMFSETNSADENVFDVAAIRSFEIFEFYVEKALTIFSEKELLQLITENIKNDINSDKNHQKKREKNISKMFDKIKQNKQFKDLLVSHGCDILISAQCNCLDMKSTCKTLNKFLTKPNELNDFFLTFDENKEPILQFAARNCDKNQFESLWNFVRSKLSATAVEVILLYKYQGLTIFQCSMVNVENGVFRFIQNLYQNKLEGKLITVQMITNVSETITDTTKTSYRNLIANKRKVLNHAARLYSREVFECFYVEETRLLTNKLRKELLKPHKNKENLLFCAMENDDENVFNFVIKLFEGIFPRNELSDVLPRIFRLHFYGNYNAKQIKSQSLNKFFIFLEELVSIKVFRNLFLSLGSYKQNALMEAALFYNIEVNNVLWKWIEEKCDLKTQKKILLQRDNCKGLTCFHYASIREDVNVFKFMINKYNKVLGHNQLKNFVADEKRCKNLFALHIDFFCNDETLDFLWSFLQELFKGEELKLKAILLSNYSRTYSGDQENFRNLAKLISSFVNKYFNDTEKRVLKTRMKPQIEKANLKGMSNKLTELRVSNETELQSLTVDHSDHLTCNTNEVIVNIPESDDDGDELNEIQRNQSWNEDRNLIKYTSVMTPKPRKRMMEDNIKLCPPPLGVLTITILQTMFYVYYQAKHNGDREDFMWGLFLSFLQMFIGIPLEYIQPWWRVMIVFLAAHLLGIFVVVTTGIIDILTIAVVQGLSIFVLLFAYIPAFLLYWRELRYRWLYFSVFMGFFYFFRASFSIRFRTV